MSQFPSVMKKTFYCISVKTAEKKQWSLLLLRDNSFTIIISDLIKIKAQIVARIKLKEQCVTHFKQSKLLHIFMKIVLKAV